MTSKKRGEGVPPLRNPDVTGLTEARQEEVIRESATAPDRGEAAEEFLDEQQEQARESGRAKDRQAAARVSAARGAHPGVVADEGKTELAKHWDPKTERKPRRGK
jgi:hypothetical protein